MSDTPKQADDAKLGENFQSVLVNLTTSALAVLHEDTPEDIDCRGSEWLAACRFTTLVLR